MIKKYKVNGIIIDANDKVRRFEVEVSVRSINEIERKIRKMFYLSRRDLIRDVSFKEID